MMIGMPHLLYTYYHFPAHTFQAYNAISRSLKTKKHLHFRKSVYLKLIISNAVPDSLMQIMECHTTTPNADASPILIISKTFSIYVHITFYINFAL
jgi:hypothetical protein